MAELHEALKQLSPTQWSDIPQDEAGLAEYMRSCFQAGELICNSIPPLTAGEPFHSAKHHHKRPNQAKSAKEMHNSTARSGAVASEHESLQKHWGKPYKFGAEKNPANVALYKMAGNDRHGAWFARRSVHEGLGFDHFRKAMTREIPHTLTVQEGPGSGAVRGLGADNRLEHKEVDGAGFLDVYQLSGQMPKPVTAREFVQVLMTTESGLSEKSAADVEGEGKHTPRSFMNVSRPLSHPDAPDRSGFVRGQYESVELIREIPLHKRKGAASTPNLHDSQSGVAEHGRDRGKTVSFAESRGSDAKGEQRDLGQAGKEEHSEEAELNPVEWIMVTRSDPGGGIPRFLVERGTPEPMLGDVIKFLDWATGLDHIPGPYDDTETAEGTAQVADFATAAGPSTGSGQAPSTAVPAEPSVQRSATAPVGTDPQAPGMFSNIASSLENGIESYAPTAVTQGLHNYLHPTHAPIGTETSDSDDSSDLSSLNSFMSADEHRRFSTIQEPGGNGEALSIRSAASSEITLDTDKKTLSSHEKEVQKILREREKLDRKLAKKREEQESKLKKAQEKDSSEEAKQREKHEKEIQKAEEKHKREVEKLEQKKAKELKKAEERRQKKDEQSRSNLVARERDEFRSQLDSYRRENKLLIDRVEELQRENTVLAGKLGRLDPGLLKEAMDEVGGVEGKKSLESVGSGKT